MGGIIMKKKEYEKPEFRLISLRTKENIADPCWSPSVNLPGTTWYYDPNGDNEGYFSFQVTTGGNAQCGSVQIEVTGKYNYPEGETPSDDELISALVSAAGGNAVQPFNSNSGIQDNPGGMS